MGAILSKCRRKEVKVMDEDEIGKGLTKQEYKEFEEDVKTTNGDGEEPKIRYVETNLKPKDEKVNDVIRAEHVKNPILRAIFSGNTEEAIEMMTALRKKEKQWSMNYEHDLLLIFWLAIDKGDTKVLNEMIDYDVSFKHIAILAFRRCWEMHEKWGTGTGDNKIGRK